MDRKTLKQMDSDLNVKIAHPQKHLFFLWIVTGICLFLELFPFLYFDQPLKMFAVVHLLVISFLLVIIIWSSKKGWDIRFPIIMALFLSTMGPLGAFIFLISLPLSHWNRSHLLSLEEIVKDFFIKVAVVPSTQLYERITHNLEKVDPEKVPPLFQDLISFGSISQKIIVIQKMLRYFNPAFVPILVQALHDPTNAIRVQAATVITTINHRYFQKYLELREQLEKSQNDQTALLNFAHFCRDYALSHVGDSERTQNMRRYALIAYEKYVEEYETTEEIQLSLGKLYLEEPGEASEAYKWLEPLINSERPSKETYQYAMATLIEMKDFKKLKEMAGRALNKPVELSEEMRKTLEMWAKGENESK